MKKTLSAFIVLIMVMFGGCAVKKEIAIAHTKSVRISDGNEKMMAAVLLHIKKVTLTLPFTARNAVYHLAKYAKQQGYNYIYVIYPKKFKEIMPSNIKDLEECFNSDWMFGKCPNINRPIIRGNDKYYLIKAVLYKKQPLNVVTLNADEILKKYGPYDLQKEGYEITKADFKVVKGR